MFRAKTYLYSMRLQNTPIFRNRVFSYMPQRAVHPCHKIPFLWQSLQLSRCICDPEEPTQFFQFPSSLPKQCPYTLPLNSLSWLCCSICYSFPSLLSSSFELLLRLSFSHGNICYSFPLPLASSLVAFAAVALVLHLSQF
jgi:hypothetical protein